VPYLESSSLMQNHKGTVNFSASKPNVLIGPNGSGKSALLTALAMRFLAYYYKRSALDWNYVSSSRDAQLWGEPNPWYSRDYEYMPGLLVKSDNAPALYYRPGHVPGNEPATGHALMCGYPKEALAYQELTENKSHGQQNQAVQAEMLDALAGTGLPADYLEINWGRGRQSVKFDRSRHRSEWDDKANALLKLAELGGSAVPLILMDEPEQSLDAKSELNLWNRIAKADCSAMQLIVATHSMYPFLHPERFNLIETEPGYLNSVLALLK
jgi:energy-coupling factor transporter ATP-binding protein EcfA2